MKIQAFRNDGFANASCSSKAKMSALSKVGISVFSLLVVRVGGCEPDGCGADEQARAEFGLMSWRGGQLVTPGARRFHGLNGCVKRPISNQAGLGRFRLGRYFASKPVKSLALEQRISSICRARTSALVLSASIFDMSGCFFSSSSIRLLNEARAGWV